MEPITLRQLEFALAVEEAGAICAAAKLLHISQPSLSQQIQQLEKTLGAELFVRTPSGTEPTEAGRAFLCHARNALEDVRRARSSVAGLPHRPLRVGIEHLVDIQPVIAAANDTFGAKAASAFQVVQYPTPEALCRALRFGETDIGVGASQPTWEGIQVALGDVRLSLSTPTGTTREQLSELTWFRVVGTGPYVSELLARLQFDTLPRIVDTERFEYARAMVTQGLGASVTPDPWDDGTGTSPDPDVPAVRVPISVMANTLDGTSREFVTNLLRQFARQSRERFVQHASS